MFKKLLLLLLTVAFSLILHAAENPINADIVVAADGSGDFTTMQDAINAVPSNSSRRTVIYIKRGLYDTEKLIVPSDKINVSLIGESRDETIISYHIYDCASPESGNKCPAEDAGLWTGETIRTSATLTIDGDGFRAENLTIRNTAGPVGQALAITVRSDKNMFINCNILGYQDTIYLWTAGKRSYFENCLVLGRTDYIYGAGIGYFQECEIRSWGGGWITAPSTPKEQKYGYVFNECELTYATNSPRAGDDGATIALGRPWHEYPKVTWMNSYFCAEINPVGWPTTWNMSYANTSTDLELYEYNNNGPGADMSGRANWAGLRALTVGEAPNYTIQKVMAGGDNWDPTKEAPLVNTYQWTDSASTKGWLKADNWSTKNIPLSGEIAIVDSGFSIIADSGSFLADLNMMPYSELNLAKSVSCSYLTMKDATLSTDDSYTLSGKISTKGSNTIDVTGNLNIAATIIGVHDFILTNTGTVELSSKNESYTGTLYVNNGNLLASAEGSLGIGNIDVSKDGKLTISNEAALHPKSRISVVAGASVELNNDITLSEFFIDGILQPLGVYNATTNPALISGSGSITVGRPDVFEFIGSVSGNWDNALNFSPQLLPEAGETVICEREMETTNTTFTADITLTGKGSIRFRGTHTCTGLITMREGAKFSYATSGTGFTLDAPVFIEGDVRMEMNSANTAGNAMRLPGQISGSAKVVAVNRKAEECTATLVLSGNNEGFNGIWDLTSTPAATNSVAAIEAAGENSLGFGTVEIGDGNKLVLSHNKGAGDTLIVNISGGGLINLKKDINIEKFVLNGVSQDTGAYNSNTNPDVLEGNAELIVGRVYPPDDTTTTAINESYNLIKPVSIQGKKVIINGEDSFVQIINVNGVIEAIYKRENVIYLEDLKKGLYVIKYSVDGVYGTIKVAL